jgi:hypothetical protein
MKKLFAALCIAGGLTLALLLALSLLAAQLRGPTFDPVAAAKAQIAIDQANAIAPAQIAAAFVLALMPAALAMLLLVLLTAGGSVAIWRFFRERRPNHAGLLPVNAYRLDDVAPAALGAFHAARQLEAGRQMVPHTLTYSPSEHYAPHSAATYAPRLDYDYRGDAGGNALPPPDEPLTDLLQLPGLTDLAHLGFRPTKEAILLGLAEGGEQITVPMRALWHIGTAGPTGAGKSNVARLIIPQLQALGAKVAIIDPKWTPYDAEANGGQGEDWRLIAQRLFLPAARKAEAMRETIGYFHDELDRRLDLRNAGQKVGGPLFLYCDEYTTITEDVKDAGERIARLARLGRGVGIFLLIAAHDLLVKSGAGDTRDQLRTGFYLGGDSKTGAVLLDLPQKAVIAREGELTLGAAMLRSAATSPARLVRVPYASDAAIAGLLGEGEGADAQAVAPATPRPIGFYVQAADDAPARPRPGPGLDNGPAQAIALGRDKTPLDAEAARILSKLVAGATVSELATELSGTSNPGDRRHKAAREKVEALLRQIAADRVALA